MTWNSARPSSRSRAAANSSGRAASMGAERPPQQGAVSCAPDPGLGGYCHNSREAAFFLLPNALA
ncbi:MAG TPA: hypothetical protein VNV62_15035 [Trebonia sp.]|nr:hypothetical protein [Trebonia sp.]